jgi:hypothetical protein
MTAERGRGWNSLGRYARIIDEKGANCIHFVQKQGPLGADLWKNRRDRGSGQNPGGTKLSRAPEGLGVLHFRYVTDSFANYGMMAVLVYYLLSKKLAIGKGFRE